MTGSEGIEIRSASQEDGAMKGRVETAASITCWKNARGDIRTNVDPHFTLSQDRMEAWGSCSEHQTSNRIAADILYCFLQSSTSPTSNLRYRDALYATEAGWTDNPYELPREFLVVLELAQAFRADIIDDMPRDCSCHIEDETVWAWLDRHTIDDSHDADESLRLEQEERYISDCCGDVENLGFENHGFVCARDAENPTFNIAQRLWLHKRERMDWLGNTNATRTLAANVIDRFLGSRIVDSSVRRQINGSVGDFYDPFRADFLEEMPRNGGQIPCSVLQSWLQRRL